MCYFCVYAFLYYQIYAIIYYLTIFYTPYCFCMQVNGHDGNSEKAARKITMGDQEDKGDEEANKGDDEEDIKEGG